MRRTMKRTTGLAAALIATFLGGLQSKATVSFSALPNMSLLTPYATFGYSYNDSAVTINGDSAISNGGNIAIAAPSTINGNLYLGTGATRTGAGGVTGTTFSGLDLSAAQTQVGTASSALAALTADVTGGNITTSQTYGSVNGVADVFVVDIASLALGSGQYIHFSGDPGDVFVLNISGSVALTGDAPIGTAGQGSHILVNLTSGGNMGTIAHVGNVINGTTLIPNASATLHSVSGAIYSGLGTITLMSDATVNYESFVPEPATYFAGALLLLPFGASALRIMRKSC